jgi:hypothetical protein
MHDLHLALCVGDLGLGNDCQQNDALF